MSISHIEVTTRLDSNEVTRRVNLMGSHTSLESMIVISIYGIEISHLTSLEE